MKLIGICIDVVFFAPKITLLFSLSFTSHKTSQYAILLVSEECLPWKCISCPSLSQASLQLRKPMLPWFFSVNRYSFRDQNCNKNCQHRTRRIVSATCFARSYLGAACKRGLPSRLLAACVAVVFPGHRIVFSFPFPWQLCCSLLHHQYVPL